MLQGGKNDMKIKKEYEGLTLPQQCLAILLNQVRLMPGIGSSKFYLTKNVSSKCTASKLIY